MMVEKYVFQSNSLTISRIYLIASDEEVALEEGNIFLIRYSAVRSYVISGDVEII